MTPAPDLSPRPGEWAGIQNRAGRRRRRRQLLTAAGSAGTLAVVAVVGALALQSNPGTARIQQVAPAAPGSGSFSPAATATLAPTACTTSAALPASRLEKAIPDVDGDGHGDTGFISGTGTGPTTIGIRTAAGGVFTATFTSANTTSNYRGVVFADVSGTGAGPFVALTDDNRSSLLFVVQGCALVPAVGPEGVQYLFDLGYSGNGDGVSCGTVAGTTARSLIGFGYLRTSEEIRTAITVDTEAGTAANGDATDTVTTRDTTRVSCGDATAEGLELGG